MIRINLLPSEGVKRSARHRVASPKPSVLVVAILIGAYLAVAVLVGFTYYQRQVAKKALSDAKDRKQQIEDEIARIQEDFKGLKEIEELLANQVEILKALDTPNKILWAEKLSMLSAMIPSNVYITKLEMREKQTSVPTLESQRRMAEWNKLSKEEKQKVEQPQKVVKPQITQTLWIHGISKADTPEKCFDLIVDFQKAMDTFKETRRTGSASSFMDSIEDIRMIDSTMDKVGQVPVRRFVFEVRTKPFISQ